MDDAFEGEALARESVTIRRSPLFALAPLVVPGRVEVRAGRAISRFSFRGDSDAARACGDAFGPALAREVCTATRIDERTALALGPDEWLLLAPLDKGPVLATKIKAALGSSPHSLVDVSHRQVALSVTGRDAALLLRAFCLLDLDEAAFPVAMATRTIFAKCEVVLWRRGQHDFHIEVARSFAPYLMGLFGEAIKDLDDPQ
ncbi:MAG: sarcosine oxidase subunit gamma family protein [Pseudomonadota bacterium]